MEPVTSETGNRSEGSLVTSLAELRALELERQAEERAASEAAVAARRREREAAEQAAQDAEAARIAAERAAEQASAAAKREARLQIEKLEATERARRLVALEEHRVAEELALQREAALRQRPRWLLTLTALAVAASAWLGWFAIDCRRDATAAADDRDRALTSQAEASATIERKDHELAALRTQLEDANHRADEARRDADAHASQPSPRGPALGAPRRPHVGPPPPAAPVHIPDNCLVNPLCDPTAASQPGDPHTRRK
jgi:hypothetical protein